MPGPELDKALDAIKRGEDSLKRNPPRMPVPLGIGDLNLPDPVEQNLISTIAGLRVPPFLRASGGTGMPIKVVYAFAGPDGGYWTEVYHLQSGTPVSAVQAALATLNVRLAFMSSQCHSLFIQASDESVPKSAYRTYVENAGLLAASGAVNIIGDLADCLIYKLYDALARKVEKFYRGCPANQFIRNADGTEHTPSSDSLIKAWFATCVTLGYGWYTVTPVSKVPGNQFAWNPITQVDGLTNPGFAILTMTNNVTLTANSQVYISQCDGKTLPGIGGIWNAGPGSLPNQVVIKYQVAGNRVIGEPKGRMRVYAATWSAFAAFPTGGTAFDGFGSRKTRSYFTRGRRGQSVKGIRLLA